MAVLATHSPKALWKGPKTLKACCQCSGMIKHKKLGVRVELCATGQECKASQWV
jgi:hypothetical protein